MRWTPRSPLIGMLLLLALAIVFAPSSRSQTLSIGSYNLENYFDVFDNPYTADEGTDVKRREEIHHLASALAVLDADVVVFEELENVHVLQAMVNDYLADKGYDYVGCQQTNDGRGINLGVISRYPIMELRSYRFQTLTNPAAPGKTWRFARDLMRVTLDVGLDRPVEVFCVHLKSNGSRPGDPNSMLFRTAEAIRVKEIIRSEVAKDPGMLAVVAGDFNSMYETRPDQDRPWPAMAHLLEPEADGSQLLTDVHSALSDEQRVTIPGDGRYPPATFDYILATPAMAECYVEGSASVIRDPELTSGSDHRPIKASFKLD